MQPYCHPQFGSREGSRAVVLHDQPTGVLAPKLSQTGGAPPSEGQNSNPSYNTRIISDQVFFWVHQNLAERMLAAAGMEAEAARG